MLLGKPLRKWKVMQPKSKRALVNEILPSIAMVEDLSLTGPRRIVGQNIAGTAFVADLRGYFLTARHVVQGRRAEEIEVRTTHSATVGGGYAMKKTTVEAIFPHPVLDIAVLAVHGAQPPGRMRLKLEPDDDIGVGSDVLLIGYGTGTDLVFCDEILGAGSPKSFSPVVFNGMICAQIPDDGRPVDLLVYDCSTFGGNSGGPVVSVESGNIVALHLRGYEHHVGYGIPIDRCTEFVATIAAIHEGRRAKSKNRERRTNATR